MVAVSLSAEKIRSIEEWLEISGLDPQTTIADQDLVSIQMLISSPFIEEDARNILLTLDILPTSDIEKIQSSSSLKTLLADKEFSATGIMLIQNISFIPTISHYVSMAEKISFKDINTNHKWKFYGHIGQIQFGFLTENDPGEKNILDHQTIYTMGNNGPIKWIIGDHQLAGGFGLISWKPSSTYKSFDAIQSLSRTGNGISGYISGNEYWNVRGGAIQLGSQYGNFTFSLGRTFRDGIIENQKVKLDLSGEHVSTSSLLMKNNLLEQSSTLMWENRFSENVLGLIAHSDYVMDDHNKVLTNSISFYGKGKIKSWTIFGEAASNFDHIAMISGIQYSSSPMKYLFSQRYYPPAYKIFRSQPFAEWYSINDGETGWFHNIQFNFKNNAIAFFNDTAVKKSLVFPGANNVYKTEFGSRWKWNSKRKNFILQYKEALHTEEESLYAAETTKRTLQSESLKAVYFINSASYDLKWTLNFVNYNQGSTAVGLESKLNYSISSWTVTANWIVSFIQGSGARLYFWDLNLPGEMSNFSISESGHVTGFRVLLKSNHGYQLHFRWRCEWDSLEFAATPETFSSIAIQMNF